LVEENHKVLDVGTYSKDPVDYPDYAEAVGAALRESRAERGIKQIDGFMSERWRIEPEYVVKIDHSLGFLGVLLEPATVVAKAWEQIAGVGQRALQREAEDIKVGIQFAKP
jgi:hypothetical protein